MVVLLHRNVRRFPVLLPRRLLAAHARLQRAIHRASARPAARRRDRHARRASDLPAVRQRRRSGRMASELMSDGPRVFQ